MSEFTYEHAMSLISKMRINYGKKFADQWSGVTPRELANEMLNSYQGLTQSDFQRGLSRMNHEKWPPTIPEFRSWCEPKSGDWLDAHEAWAIARNSIEFGTGRELTVIWTEQTAKAFDKCVDLVVTGDKYQLAEAKKIFISIYDRLITEAKDQGLKPVYITSLGIDKDQQISAIEQAQFDGFLTAPEAKAQLEHNPKKSNSDKRYKTLAQEALEKLKGQLKAKNPVNKLTPECIEPQPWESAKQEHIDPFDQFEQYKSMLERDGKKIPLSLRGAA